MDAMVMYMWNGVHIIDRELTGRTVEDAVGEVVKEAEDVGADFAYITWRVPGMEWCPVSRILRDCGKWRLA